MLKSKLMDVFLALTPPMRRDLRQWVKSPFFNLRKDVVDLYAYLDTTPPMKTKMFAKEVAFEAVFPDDKKFDDSKMRYTMSFLLKTIEQYLAFHASTNDAVIEEWYLAVAYKGLGMEKYFDSTIEKLQKHLSEKPNNVQRMRRFFDIERIINAYLNQRKRANEQNLEELSMRLDQFYAAEKLYIVCGLLSHQQMFKNAYDTRGVEAIVQQVEHHNWHETVPGIGVYYYTYQMYTNADPEFFYKAFKERLPEYIDIIENIDLRSAFLSAINFVIRKVNTANQPEYFKDLFELYKIGIESKVLLENGELSPFTYKNVAAIGLRLNETAYVTDFIERYRDALPFEHRKNFYDYCRARLYFTQHNYEKAMPILGQMNYGDIYLQLDANVMLCKMYFEMKETDALNSFLHTFKQFIRRKKDAIGYHYDNYYNIIRLVGRLSHAEFHDTKSNARLLKEIEACTPLTEKVWFLEQMAKIK